MLEPVSSRKATDLMADVLKESGEARNYSISLDGHELSKELVSQMATHASQMKKLACTGAIFHNFLLWLF